MSDISETYKKAKNRQKKSPVRRIVVSPEAQREYEALVRQRDERDRTYGRHLTADNKPR